MRRRRGRPPARTRAGAGSDRPRRGARPRAAGATPASRIGGHGAGGPALPGESPAGPRRHALPEEGPAGARRRALRRDRPAARERGRAPRGRPPAPRRTFLHGGARCTNCGRIADVHGEFTAVSARDGSIRPPVARPRAETSTELWALPSLDEGRRAALRARWAAFWYSRALVWGAGMAAILAFGFFPSAVVLSAVYSEGLFLLRRLLRLRPGAAALGDGLRPRPPVAPPVRARDLPPLDRARPMGAGAALGPPGDGDAGGAAGGLERAVRDLVLGTLTVEGAPPVAEPAWR